MTVTRSAGILCLIMGLTPTAASAGSGALELAVTVGQATTSCSEDGLTFSSTFVLQVHVTNPSGAIVILSRRFETALWYRIAASAEDANRGKFQTFNAHEYWPGAVAPTFGRTPDDARFERLWPGATAERVVEVHVPTSLAPGGSPGFAAAGETYVLQTAIKTWPYLLTSTEERRAVVDRWRAQGILVTETFDIPFITIHVPSEAERCESGERGRPTSGCS